jgi:hypothetical protein
MGRPAVPAGSRIGPPAAGQFPGPEPAPLGQVGVHQRAVGVGVGPPREVAAHPEVA